MSPKNYSEFDIFRLIVKKSIEKKGGKMLTASVLLDWLIAADILQRKMQEAANNSMYEIEKQIETLI